ncbi:43 kDa receptor-associated protein of the synapse-like [Argopecten irradians]|uniref:43 kDa receptor-associated protein of the synapse-like n=1 Tax=Argopecten irradians TaxID=31199 RepID=UPI00371AB628
MGQKVGKKGVEKGLVHYKEQRFEEAAIEFLNVLKRTHKAEEKSPDKFVIYGYLCTIYYDTGKYRDILRYADHQIDIANSLKDSGMKAEAFFNLARGNERLSLFDKAVLFCKESITINTKRSKILGYSHLCLGNAYFGLSDFCNCCKNIDLSLAIARQTKDKRLDILANVSFGIVFTTLRDYDTALYYFERALDTLHGQSDTDNLDQYQRLLEVCLAVPYFRKGRQNDAMESCEDALKMAMQYKDRPVQAKCLLTFAEIHRTRKDTERANPRYESAYSIYTEIGDRYGQMESLCGMAKSTMLSGDTQQALELYQRALDLSESIGNKFGTMQCSVALANIYSEEGNAALADTYHSATRTLAENMELFCGVCGEMMGQIPEELYPLPCGHLIHNRCGPHLARYTWGRKGTRRPCPSCRVKSSGNPILEL